MSILTQKTLKNKTYFSGVALHSGLDVNVCIKPAEPNFGIVFKRVDLKSDNIIYPNFNNVTNTALMFVLSLLNLILGLFLSELI